MATYRATFDTNDYDGNGTPEPIAVEIQHLQDGVIAILAANGIFYSDLKYSLLLCRSGVHHQLYRLGNYTGGQRTYKAAFNLQFVIKGLPSAATSQALNLITRQPSMIINTSSSCSAIPTKASTPLPELKGCTCRRPARGTRPATIYGLGQ